MRRLVWTERRAFFSWQAKPHTYAVTTPKLSTEAHRRSEKKIEWREGVDNPLGPLRSFMNACSWVTLSRSHLNLVFSFWSISPFFMSNVTPRTQKQLSAHLQHLAIEAELATNKRRRAIAEKRFRDANRPIRPISEVFADRQSWSNRASQLRRTIRPERQSQTARPSAIRHSAKSEIKYTKQARLRTLEWRIP